MNVSRKQINIDFMIRLYYNKKENSVVFTTNAQIGGNLLLLIEKYLPLLRTTRLFTDIADEDIADVFTTLQGKIKEYKGDSMIYTCGDKLKNLYLLLDGDMFLVRDDAWGNSNILMKIEPGQCFGISHTLSDDVAVTYNAITKRGCTVMLMDKQIIVTPFGEKYNVQEQLIKNIINILVNRNMYLSLKIDHLSQRKTRDKIISYLSFESQKQKSMDFNIPYSRRQLAEYLCVDRSALSNELCKLRDEGLIEFERSHFILKIDKF